MICIIGIEIFKFFNSYIRVVEIEVFVIKEKIMRLRSTHGSPFLWRNELPDPTSVTNAGSSTELRSCPRAPREMATPSTVHYSVILTFFVGNQ